MLTSDPWPYRIVFVNGEKRELVVNAAEMAYAPDSASVAFKNDDGVMVAFIPLDRILYVMKDS